jgi:CheY-like chemotaxis protein
MKILILDDQPERHEGFIRIFAERKHELTHAWTYQQAIKAMKADKFGMACLDHDLGDRAFDEGPEVTIKSFNFDLTYSPDFVNDGMYNASRRYLDGRDVVEWMVQNEFRCPPKVLIHSHNPDGARVMAERLRTISWITVFVKPFNF